MTMVRLTAEETRQIVHGHARAADRDRRLPAEAAHALTGAGFPRHFVPREYGGEAGTFADFLRNVATVAEGCAAAGWCAALFASHARMAAYLPPDGRRDLWGEGPDVRISAAITPAGTVTAAAGGWRLSGSWNFVSGVDFADWALLSGWEPGRSERRIRFFAVPRADWTVNDTWFTVGMRGTGSKTIVLDGAFVPEHRSFMQQVMLEGAAPATGEPPARCHTVPFRLVNGMSLVAPALGTARGALAAWSAWIGRKTETLMGREVHARDKASVQSALARSSVAIDAAELLLARIAATADGDEPVTPGLIARSHRDCAVAAEYLTDAVERLQRASGARGQAEDNAVARAWRDVHAAASHAALQFDVNAAAYARHVLASD
jgi:alkylation response protein AidB-like acyl-CoA dehydrogenase